VASADNQEWRRNLVMMAVLVSCPDALSGLLEVWSGTLERAAAILRGCPR